MRGSNKERDGQPMLTGEQWVLEHGVYVVDRHPGETGKRTRPEQTGTSPAKKKSKAPPGPTRQMGTHTVQIVVNIYTRSSLSFGRHCSECLHL